MAPTRAPQAQVDRVMSSRPDGSERTMVVGDSIAMLWHARQANAVFHGPVFNFGLGSDQTSQVLWRLDHADFSKAKFDRIVLIVGTNNLRQEPCEIETGIVAVQDRLRALFPKASIDYVSILPRGPHLDYAETKILEVNRQIKSKTESKGNRFIDAYTPFRAKCGHDATCDLYANQVHLTSDGYDLLGQLAGQGKS